MSLTHLRSVLSGAIVLAALAFYPACSGNSAKDSPSQAAMSFAVPVTIATVGQKTVPVELRAIGNVEAYSTVAVKSQVEGQLEGVHFREGQDVKKADLLFTIDERPFQAALRQAEANLAKDTAQAQHARAEAERYAKLVQEGIVSKEQYDQFRTNAESAEAAVGADKAAAENAQIQLGYCNIRSPIHGRTGSLLVHEGNVVKADDATLVNINQISPVLVNFAVPQKYLAEIKRRMAGGTLRVMATIPGDEQRPLQGTLSFIDNAVDTNTGTIHLKGAFANGERRLWPGQFVNASLTLSDLPGAIVAPSQAVQTGQQGQYVFVVKPDLTVDARPVTAGATFGGDTVIEKGLRVGEKVVTDGQLMLFPGAKIQPKDALEGQGQSRS